MADTTTPTADNRLTVLDCTLRDGGYYNRWDFAPDLAQAYLAAMGASGIDVVEIGFRFTATDSFYGPYAYTTDETIAALDFPSHVVPGVMCNAKDLLTFDGGGAKAVDRLFADANNSPVAMVRIAAHLREVPECGPALMRLREKGYRVGLNMMQANALAPAELAKLAETVSGWDAVEVLYFADSLGNMEREDVAAIMDALKAAWDGPLGLHAHENMGRALDNSLAAIDAGAAWIDGTVLGMGRGAGNVRIEYLLLELVRRGQAGRKPDSVLRLVSDYFEPLRAKHGWGSNQYYYLSGIYGIHPTYVQQMLSDDRYGGDEIFAVLQSLAEEGGGSYSQEGLEAAVARSFRDATGGWSAEGWAEGSDVLLIAAGPSLENHCDAILRYIERAKPKTICLNLTDLIPPTAVDLYAACHPTRMLSQLDRFRETGRPVALPVGAMPESARAHLDGIDVHDFGMKVAPGEFQTAATGCTVPAPLVAAYAMAVAGASGAKRVLLAGFDGYAADDPRHAEMNRIFDLARHAMPDTSIVAMTPTTYTVERSSIYAPAP